MRGHGRRVHIKPGFSPALGATAVHPALHLAHPVTVIDGFGIVVVLFVIVGSRQINCVRCMGIATRSKAVRRQGQKSQGKG